MKIYLSGPMKCYHDSNFPAFHATAAALRAKGLDVVNPAEIEPGMPQPKEDSLLSTQQPAKETYEHH